MQVFKQTDEEYLVEESGQPKNAGSTASTAFLVGDKLIVANVGDSRVVASRNASGFAFFVNTNLLLNAYVTDALFLLCSCSTF